jgi:hypothetical protein
MYPSTDPAVPRLSTTTLVLVIVFVLELMGIFAVHSRNTTPAQPSRTAISQSTTPAKRSNQPTFKNFEQLTDQGFTDDQSTGLKYAFTQFVQTLSPAAKVIELDKNSLAITPRDPNNPDPNNSLTFSAKAGEKNYSARVSYSGLSTVRLLVSNAKTSATLYDSGDININTSTPAD